jgi:SSS family solute:Na+ symporter
MISFMVFVCLLVAYLGIMVFFGWRGYKTTSLDLGDFFVARGHIGTLVLFLTMYATTWSAWTFMGVTGATYQLGLGWFVVCPAAAAMGVTMLLLAPRTHHWAQQFGYVTPSDFFQDRFKSSGLGLLLALVSVIGVVSYVAVQIMGIGYAFDALSGGRVPYLAGTILFLGILAIYTMFGGFRAVAWTDSVQGGFFILCLWIALMVVFSRPEIGSVAKVAETLAAQDPSPLGLPGQAGYFTHTTWISWFFLLTPGITAYPWIIQRFFSAKNVTVLYKTAGMLPLLSLLTIIPPVMVGLAGIIGMPGLDSADKAMPSMMLTYGGMLIGGIIGLGAVAAAMSTVSSIVLSLGSIVTEDLIAKYSPTIKKEQLVTWGRMSIAGWVLICLGIGIWRPTLIALMAKYDLQVIGLGLFVPLVAAVFWKQATAKGIIAGVVCGEVFGGIAAWVWTNPLGLGLDPVFWGYIVEVPVLIIVSLQTQRLPKEHIDRFFPEKVKVS